jgi:hypothetical protein
MRPQVTAYLPRKTKEWLVAYAAKLGLHRTDVVRCLLERERQVQWLQWAMQIPDPGKAACNPLPRRSDRLPPGCGGSRKAESTRKSKKR